MVHFLTVPTIAFLLLLQPGPLTLTNCFTSRTVAVGPANQRQRTPDNQCQSVHSSPFPRASFSSLMSESPVPHLNRSCFLSPGPVAPGSSLETPKVMHLLEYQNLWDRCPHPTAQDTEGWPRQGALSVGLVGWRRGEDAIQGPLSVLHTYPGRGLKSRSEKGGRTVTVAKPAW